MLSLRKISGLITIVVLSATVCGYLFIELSGEGRGGGEEEQVLEENQVWWIASDPHIGIYPGRPLDHLRVGIEDVNDLGIVDYAIQLGDEFQETMGQGYRENFFQLMNSLEVENWYYILGNHDFVMPPPSEDNLLPPVDMALDVMGMKWILISDHAGDSARYRNPPEYVGGTMPENVKDWFLDQVFLSDKPVFVFAHQPPKEWGVWKEYIRGSVKETKLRAWIYGHIHRWNASWVENQMLSFSDCSLDWADHYMGVFMFLERKGNTVDVTLRFRDHKNHEWIETPLEGENVENISFSIKVA